IYNGTETDNISDIQKTLFTKNNLYCAVSTDKSNFEKAEKIISRLKLYPDIYRKKTVFRPEISDKIIQTDNSVNNISLVFKSSSNYAEKYALALFLQNTYLWENIRCKNAYGCNCGVTPNGNIFMTSFKDIDFESSIKTMKDAFSYIQNYVFSPNDIYRLKLMCLNAILRPKTPKNANIYALKKLCGAKDITDGILSLTSQSLVSAAKNTQFIAFSAYKAKI
ncbi:MAG: hypothetical protein IJR59_02950, partial [Firmicutes bacterium]|nr:hypothetical protein [Bacillota bacterium]